MNEQNKALARAIGLAVVLLNQILVMAGFSPLPYGSEQVEIGVTAVITVVTTFYMYWKNNNLTRAAVKAQKVLDAEKGKQ